MKRLIRLTVSEIAATETILPNSKHGGDLGRLTVSEIAATETPRTTRKGRVPTVRLTVSEIAATETSVAPRHHSAATPASRSLKSRRLKREGFFWSGSFVVPPHGLGNRGDGNLNSDSGFGKCAHPPHGLGNRGDGNVVKIVKWVRK